MKELMIATKNTHKVEEFRAMLEPFGYRVLSLLDLEEDLEVEETGTTFAENALLKARGVYEAKHIACIADDSGLAVKLYGWSARGVFSAFYGKRYAL